MSDFLPFFTVTFSTVTSTASHLCTMLSIFLLFFVSYSPFPHTQAVNNSKGNERQVVLT